MRKLKRNQILIPKNNYKNESNEVTYNSTKVITLSPTFCFMLEVGFFALWADEL